MEHTSIVIRVMYNNQGWKAACQNPNEDLKCEPCLYSLVKIRPFKKNDQVCSGNCWERYLCLDYKWGCYPKGNTFARAFSGMNAFFVFKSVIGNYTIWGKSIISSIDDLPMKSEKDYEDGFKFIHFKPFDQFPAAKWVTDLTDIQLVGHNWRQGRFRYISKDKELYLEKLLKGEKLNLIKQSEITYPNNLQSANNKYCIECGKIILQKAKYCDKCGTYQL